MTPGGSIPVTRREARMASGTITVNGQHYDSPDEMPPNVRRLYELALQAATPAATSAPGEPHEGESTHVIAGSGFGVNTRIVTRTKFVVNDHTYKNLDGLPANVRVLAEDAMKQAPPTGDPAQKPGVRFTVRVTRPQLTLGMQSKPPVDPRLTMSGAAPIEPSSVGIGVRNILTTVVLLLLAGLAAWLYLNR
jgi:hypothetical protein